MKFLKSLCKKFLYMIFSPIVNELNATRVQLEKLEGIQSILAEDVILKLIPSYQNPKHIVKYPTQFYSQNSEDSIIAEIFNRIGVTNKIFLEIGIGDGAENNTRFLLESGWSGMWLEGDAANCARASQRFSEYIKTGQLIIISSLVTPENVNSLITNYFSNKVIDLLSIDIDMYTSYVWRALNLKTRVAVIEYNSAIHPAVEFEARYDEKKVWDGTNYFGASLKTLEKIGQTKNMLLVGCDYLGINAFFVSADNVKENFIEPFTAEVHFEPPKFQLLKHRGHKAYQTSHERN